MVNPDSGQYLGNEIKFVWYNSYVDIHIDVVYKDYTKEIVIQIKFNYHGKEIGKTTFETSLNPSISLMNKAEAYFQTIICVVCFFVISIESPLTHLHPTGLMTTPKLVHFLGGDFLYLVHNT